MDTKTALLFALLLPGLTALAACDRADDATLPAAATAPDMPPADTMPDTMPTDPPPMTGDDTTFVEMDRNQDGGITRDELATTDMLYQHFSVADADGDGSLSETEVTQHRADMAAPAD